MLSFAIRIDRFGLGKAAVCAVLTSVLVDRSETLLSKVEIFSVLEVFGFAHFKLVALVVLEHVTKRLHTLDVDIV